MARQETPLNLRLCRQTHAHCLVTHFDSPYIPSCIMGKHGKDDGSGSKKKRKHAEAELQPSAAHARPATLAPAPAAAAATQQQPVAPGIAVPGAAARPLLAPALMAAVAAGAPGRGVRFEERPEKRSR